jgi:hypothetical protein
MNDDLAIDINVDDVLKDSGHLLPQGDYQLYIRSTSVDRTKKQQIPMLTVLFEVVDPPMYKGRTIYQPFFYTSEKGKYLLAKLVKACGLTQITSASDLYGKIILAEVRIREDPTGQYEPQNSVYKIRQIEQTARPAPAQQATPPWARPAAHDDAPF